MKFHFSIGTAVRESWQSFWRHPWFFVGMAFIMAILNIFQGDHHQWLLLTLVILAELVWGYVWLSVALAAADGKEDILNFKSLSVHMPTFRQFFMLIGVSIIVGLIIILGLVLLIIPGLYFAVRLVFAKFAYVDHQQSIKKSLEVSWHMVKGNIFWIVVLVGLVQLGILILGVVALLIGLLVAYPLIMLFGARFYRTLDTHYRNNSITAA